MGSIQGRQKFVCEDAVTVPSAREEFYMKKMAVISAKQALVSTEQVQKLIAIADFELQNFGSRPAEVQSSAFRLLCSRTT